MVWNEGHGKGRGRGCLLIEEGTQRGRKSEGISREKEMRANGEERGEKERPRKRDRRKGVED